MKDTAAFRRLDALLREAEADRRCFVTSDPAVYELARRYMDSGFLVRPFPNMFMRAEKWKSLENVHRQRWRYVQDAYVREHPSDVLCSFSAALQYGLWVSRKRVETMHIAVSSRSSARKSGGVHRHYCPSDSFTELDGVRVTDLMRTVLDCCLEGTFADGLAIADSALRYCGLDLDAFKGYAAKNGTGRRGAQRARDVARYADGAAENAGESIVRARIIELGYMAPTGLQIELPDPVEGGRMIRGDMYFILPDGSMVIGEVDGLGKYGKGETVKKELVKERQRESHITALGVPVMRILFSDIYSPGYLQNILDSFGIPKRKGH